MYSTCVVCTASLGANEAIEHFPIGTRLAFDAAKGLLWVVCRRCERWNLTPLEERWEAIEECERHYRDTRLRVATDNIGLARLPDGTELVRIGKPLKPELAAWRYGDQFGRRRRNAMIKGGIATAAVVGGVVAVPTLGLPLAAFGVLGVAAFQVAMVSGIVAASGAYHGTVWLTDEQGRHLLVTGDSVSHIRIVAAEGGFALRVEYAGRFNDKQQWTQIFAASRAGRGIQPAYPVGEAAITGDAALSAARTLLPRLNGAGAKRGVVQDAVSTLSQLGSGADAFKTAASRIREFGARQVTGDTGALAHLPADVRLALEMAAFEDQERLALEGELAGLERAWRDADELAGIADRLLEPPTVTSAMDRLRAKVRPASSDGSRGRKD